MHLRVLLKSRKGLVGMLCLCVVISVLPSLLASKDTHDPLDFRDNRGKAQWPKDEHKLCTFEDVQHHILPFSARLSTDRHTPYHEPPHDPTDNVCKHPHYAIIVKGLPYRVNELKVFLEYYLRYNHNVLVLYSFFANNQTHHDNLAPLYDLAKKQPCFELVLSPYPCKRGIANAHNQRISVSQGLYRAHLRGAVFVTITRSDQLITPPGFMSMMENLVRINPLPEHIRDQRFRLVSDSRVTIPPNVGFCHIDDQFMFGHIADLMDYWGNLPQNRFVDLRVNKQPCIQHVPVFNVFGDGAPPPEVAACQAWLRFKNLNYTNMRVLIKERLLVMRDSRFRTIWNHHHSVNAADKGVEYLSKICQEMDNVKYEFGKDLCLNWEKPFWYEPYSAHTLCDREMYTYNCDRIINNIVGDFEGEPLLTKECPSPYPPDWIPKF